MAAPHSHSGANSVQVVVLMPLDLLERVDARAKADGITRSALIRQAVLVAIDKEADHA